MNDSIWDILKIEPVKDKKQIKRAYAKAVKTCHPEENPEEFKRLHDAYEKALQYAESSEQYMFRPDNTIVIREDADTGEIIKFLKKKIDDMASETKEDDEKVNKESSEAAKFREIYQKASEKEKEEKKENSHFTEKEIEEEEEELSKAAKFREIYQKASEKEEKSHFTEKEPDEREKIGGYFAAREQEKTENMERFFHRAQWFQQHWNEAQVQEEMTCYLSSSEFATIKEALEVINFLYYGLNDRRNVFCNAIKNAIWEQYGFTFEEALNEDDIHYRIYRILLRDQKSRILEAENKEFCAIMEECNKIAAIKRKKFLKFLMAVGVLFVFVLIGAAGVYFWEKVQIKSEHEMRNDEILELLQDKYPNITFSALTVIQRKKDKGTYQVIALADNEYIQNCDVCIDVYVGEDGSIQISDNVGEQCIEEVMKRYRISLSLENEDSLLVAYYTPNEIERMERLCNFLAGNTFKEGFLWIDEVLFCYEDASYTRYFFGGGEGGIPRVMKYAVDSIPDKEQLMDEMYYQGLFYSMHYEPWRIKPEFLDEYAAEYNAEAASFEKEQEELLESASKLLGEWTAEQARELVELADSYGVKLLLLQDKDDLCITDGDWYRLLVAAGADVERNSTHTGFVLRTGGITILYGAGVSSHVTRCKDALKYLQLCNI